MASPAGIKDTHKEKAIFFNRLMVVVLLMLAVFSGLAYRYYTLQITDYQSYQTQSERNRVQLRPVPPVRGLIFDRNGILLAENRPSYQLAVVRERVEDLEVALGQLKDLLGLSDEEILVLVQDAFDNNKPVTCGTLSGEQSEDLTKAANAKNVHWNHAYAPISVDPGAKTISLQNPWGTSHVMDLSIADFRRFYKTIRIGGAI